MKNKLKIIYNDLRAVAAIKANTGNMPRGHNCTVTIETTSVCNLACPLCPTGTKTLIRDKKFIDIAHFKKMVDITYPYATSYVLNIWGEPTFHPQFFELLDMIPNKTIWLSTHLNYSNKVAEELAKRPNLLLICSIDTLNPEEYPKYRINGNYQQVMDNFAILAKGECKPYPQFLIEPNGVEEKKAILSFAAKHHIPDSQLTIKEKRDNFRLDESDEAIKGVCHSPYMDIYFNCDGYLIPCCNNIRKELYIDHIDNLNGIEDITHGTKFSRVRTQLAKDKNVYACCHLCRGETWRNTIAPKYQNYINKINSLSKKKA
ncbi:radical SAM protein [uncultured Pseudodesulfovibrio sp.]|uniref:radical SAM/SPASM domain-containing protein n=1 Tax=uncultured Pseudodesulfovibrio sp. TaxID=2035858 RepID=UPI0029C799CA|nr:radical SAM protein [uncultured Pseudodesulfovibrio sp.]